MSDSTDRIVAIKAVMDLVEPDYEIKLTQGEVELEVDRARLVTTWQPNTAYKIGDVTVPAERNDHCYESIQPGTSRASSYSFLDWPQMIGSTFGDGNSSPQLIWQEVGTDLFNPNIAGAKRNIYDIELAAKRLSKRQLARAGQWLDEGDASFEQMYKHLKEKVDRFKPFRRQMQLIRS